MKFHHLTEQICQNSKNKNRKKKRKTVVSLKLSQYLSIFSWVTNKNSTCSKKKCPVFTMSVNIHIIKIQFYLRPWCRGFPINFAKFIRTPFLQNTSGRLLLLSTRCIHLRRANKTPFSSPFTFLLRFLFLRWYYISMFALIFLGFSFKSESRFSFSLKVFEQTKLQTASIVLCRCFRSSCPEVFCWKDALKMCRKFTGEHLCRRRISIKLRSHFGMGVLL